MATKISLDDFEWKNKKFPMGPVFKSVAKPLVAYLKEIGEELGNEIQNDMATTTESSTGQTPDEALYSGGYFAKLLQVTVTDDFKYVPVIIVTSRGRNAVQYENAHGQIVKGIAKMGGK